MYFYGQKQGHRKYYADFLSKGATKWVKLHQFLIKKDIWFVNIDDNYLLYILVFSIRGLLGRKTFGLSTALYCPSRNYFKNKIKILLRIVISYFNCLQQTYVIGANNKKVTNNLCEIIDPAFFYWEKILQNIVVPESKENSKELKMIYLGFGSSSKLYHLEKLSKQFIDFKTEVYITNNIDLDTKTTGYTFCKNLSDQDYFDIAYSSNCLYCYYDDYNNKSSGLASLGINLGKMILCRENSIVHKMCLSFSYTDFLTIEDSIIMTPTQPFESSVKQNKVHFFKMLGLNE